MIKYSIALVFSMFIILSCESKKENESTTDTASTSDTTSTVDTTSTYEKQHYGNENSHTSGNSGH